MINFTSMPRQHKAAQGFTLIEIMIAVVIVGILAAIAFPSYTSFLQKSRRSGAKSVLLNIAARQENYFADLKRYADKPTDLGFAADTLYVNGQGETGASQQNNSYYSVTLSQTANFDFLATATAIGSQAKDTDCAEYTVDHQGNRTATSSSCW